MGDQVQRPERAEETPYYQADRRYLQPSFVDPDSDGDGILDGNDDQDHDGYLNWFEVSRPSDWETTYTSTKFPFPATSGHTNRLARVNPFNPCKPINSEACHGLDNEPGGYYPPDEDWFNDVTPAQAPASPGTLPR